MLSLSNNRDNAIGAFCVNANNAPSNANGNNWGCRAPARCGLAGFLQVHLGMFLNQPLSKNDSSLAARPAGCKPRFVSQSPLEKRGAVGWCQPLEATRVERDAGRRLAA